MALTLLRHAALLPKHQKRYNGWTDLSIDPSCFHFDAVRILQQQTFDSIYSSDLVRCQETLLMMDIETYQTDERLREIRFHTHIEGLNFDEISKLPSFKPEYLEDATLWQNYICKESNEAFEARILSFLDALPQGQEILICSHGGTLQKILALLGYNKTNIQNLEWVRIENGVC